MTLSGAVGVTVSGPDAVACGTMGLVRRRPTRGGNVLRLVRWTLLVGLAWTVVHALPSLARYFKMREL